MRYVGGKGAIARDIVRVIRERSTGDVVYEPFMGGGIVTAVAAIVLTEFGQIPTLIGVSIIFGFWVWLGLRLGQSPKATKRRTGIEKRLGSFASKAQQ